MDRIVYWVGKNPKVLKRTVYVAVGLWLGKCESVAFGGPYCMCVVQYSGFVVWNS